MFFSLTNTTPTLRAASRLVSGRDSICPNRLTGDRVMNVLFPLIILVAPSFPLRSQSDPTPSLCHCNQQTTGRDHYPSRLDRWTNNAGWMIPAAEWVALSVVTLHFDTNWLWWTWSHYYPLSPVGFRQRGKIDPMEIRFLSNTTTTTLTIPLFPSSGCGVVCLKESGLTEEKQRRGWRRMKKRAVVNGSN